MKESLKITGLKGASKAWYISKQLDSSENGILVICDNQKESEDLFNDLQIFTNNDSSAYIPAWDTLPFETVSPSINITFQRISNLKKLYNKEKKIFITDIPSIFQKILPKQFYEKLSFTLRIGQKLNRENLIQNLICCGFTKTSNAEKLGQFAIRGLVIDIALKNGVRIEVDIDVIQKIKLYDLNTQRTYSEIDFIDIIPIKEFTYLNQSQIFETNVKVKELCRSIRERAEKLNIPSRDIENVTSCWEEGISYPGIELSFLMTYKNLPNISSFNLKKIIFNSDSFLENIEKYQSFLIERQNSAASEGIFHTDVNLSYNNVETIYEETKNSLSIHNLQLANETYETYQSKNLTELIELKSSPRLQIEKLSSIINQWRNKNYKIGICVGSEKRAKYLEKLLLEENLKSNLISLSESKSWINTLNNYPLVLIPAKLSEGFILESEKLILIAENDIFLKSTYSKNNYLSNNLNKIKQKLYLFKPNDLIIHEDFGLGLYHGLETKTVEKQVEDFLHIEYQDSKLFLPIQHIAKIQKYSGPEGLMPALDKLSTKSWEKTRKKVFETALILAGDLLNLYAKRDVITGYTFENINNEDQEFKEEFPYEETPDQEKAIEAVLSDMASNKPMDRLICGDVGFGKTEVAMRAAFKCAQSGKQVAVLAPTTILVDQHLKTFQERFSKYPFNINAVSRFYPSSENKKNIENLSNGKIDIIIGTHKLLQANINFKDLGLVIIDEEHRFGVKQKERLKTLKTSIDMLSLSATPIPRTLNLSLSGIRDISLITTPPTARQSINTYIAQNDDNLIRQVILREIQRGGQAFFVHNRIETISSVAEKLERLIPEAKFAVGHGKMKEEKLENLMKSFVEKDFDVLICTTIIESGLDITNANTMIIDRADRFGLAQLYQLRGRVGRGDQKAFTYFLIPEIKKITPDAKRRLEAIQSLNDLGLGFSLALRDLEIRGVGNILGKEQSGSIGKVGYEMYMKILKSAVEKVKYGKISSITEALEPEVKLGINAYIPEEYIPDTSERLLIYQRLATFDESVEDNSMLEEIYDRFGSPPKEVISLIKIMKVRSLLKGLGILKLEKRATKVTFSFSNIASIDSEKLVLIASKDKNIRIGKNNTISFILEHEEIEDIYEFCASFLRKIPFKSN